VEDKNKGKFIAFFLGLVLGGKVLPWFIHLIYISIIILVWLILK